jgi:hypothetical protein
MNKEEFLNVVNKNINSVLCIDFDGVIHDNHSGFHDGTCYGEPIDGAIESLERLSKRFEIIIYTCKANPNRPLIDNKNGIELIWEWLDKYEASQYVKDITFNKPNAVAYIDDKAIRFENWEQIHKEL